MTASFQALAQQLQKIQAQISALKDAGYVPYPAGFVLDSNVVKGKTYYRKRVRQEDGRPGKAQQISAETYTQLKGELERGKAIHKLEKQKDKLVARMNAVANRVVNLGGILLPNRKETGDWAELL